MSHRTTNPYALNAGTVLVLQSMTSYPSVSLLLPTTPGQMTASDRARFHGLRETAARRLQEEVSAPDGRDFSADRILVELDQLRDHAADLTLDRGLALFVNEHHAQLVILPDAVAERVVIDPTFATRDLVRALHRTPRHVVLVLSAHEARLFEDIAGRLAPAEGSKFPLTARPAASDPMSGPGVGPGSARRYGKGTKRRAQAPASFLTQVDHALGAYLRLRPAPVAVIAAEPTLSRFCQTSTNLDRLAGKIAGHHLTSPLDHIAALVAPHLEAYLASRQSEALELLDRRRGQDLAVFGLDAVWLAARWERPEMLAVEDDFVYPARLSPDGDTLQAAEDVEHPDVIDDVVDELIEHVLARGAWVAIVEPGNIPDGQRVALTTRHR